MMMTFYRVFYNFVLSRRYKVTIKNIDLLKIDCGKLILPNHQSHIDPQIIGTVAHKYADIVPVVSENFFKVPIVRFFMKKWGAVPVSDISKSNRDPNYLQKITSQVIVELNKKKNVIIFPAGQLTNQGIEKIKNKQSTYAIVSQLPDDIKVIGVRFRGLWGSMWSKAWDGTLPVFMNTFLKGIFYFFANFIFFCPKRKVIIELEDITEEAKLMATKDRKTFNTFLEDFYNIHGVEEPTYIKHFFYFPTLKKKLPENIK